MVRNCMHVHCFFVLGIVLGFLKGDTWYELRLTVTFGRYLSFSECHADKQGCSFVALVYVRVRVCVHVTVCACA